MNISGPYSDSGSGEFLPYSRSDSEESRSDYGGQSPDSHGSFYDRSYVCWLNGTFNRDLLYTRIPIATWRLAELEFFSTKIPIAKWRLKDFYMEKKNKMYRGTGSSFGFKKPVSSTANAKPIPISNSIPPPQEQLTNSIDTTSNAQSGTPRLPRNGSNGLINRFGFRPTAPLSNKVADSQNDINSTKARDVVVKKPSMLPQPKSHLPRPQFPVRLVAPAGYHPPPRTASADKHAKTAANNHTARRSRSEHGGSSASSVNDVDSGISSQKSGCEIDMIEQLECSPSARNRRPRAIKIPAGKERRDLTDSIEVTEIVPLKLPPLRMHQDNVKIHQSLSQDNSASSEEDEITEDESSEEKQHRDRVLSEKDERGVMGAGEEGADCEDLWGHGEAMVEAGEDDMPLEGQAMDLSLEDTDDSPGSPGTPTHLSNSLSLSSDFRDRDFIDDEICDQPDLVYENVTLVNSSNNTVIQDESSPKFSKPVNSSGLVPVVDCASARHSSVGTLSPCESIASDDLMMDYDLSAVDDDHRLETSSLEAALTDGEGDERTEQVIQEINSLLAARPEFANGVRATRQLRPRVGSSGSGADSPRSLDTPRLRSGSALSSPLRSRQGASSPGEDISEDSGIRVNRSTYQAMYQDVINIKALLLRLSRVVQESEPDNCHDTSQRNGLYNCESSAEHKSEASQQEVIADLQRQVLFLQSQVEERGRTIQEKDRMIQSLQMTKQPEPQGQVETCNAATQTERVRPLSTGPVLSTQPDAAGGSFVSNTSESGKFQPAHNTRPVSRLPQWRRTTSPSCELHKPLPLMKQT